MGKFKDWLFMKGDYAPRDEADAPAASAADEPDIVRIDVPFYPLGMTAVGYGALMSVDYAACEQTKARSLASTGLGSRQASAHKNRKPLTC